MEKRHRFLKKTTITGVLHRAGYGEYGMPSSHAQFMGFLTAYLLLWIVIRQQIVRSERLLKLLEIGTLNTLCALVCASR